MEGLAEKICYIPQSLEILGQSQGTTKKQKIKETIWSEVNNRIIRNINLAWETYRMALTGKIRRILKNKIFERNEAWKWRKM